jgi:mono/diheme cytochrome c family protein
VRIYRLSFWIFLAWLPIQTWAADGPGSGRGYDPAQLARAEKLYQEHCGFCHGERGRGISSHWASRGPDGRYVPPPLDGSAHAWHHSAADLKRVIKRGVLGAAAGDMPAYEGKLTDQEIEDMVVWITSLWSDEAYNYWWQTFERKGR